MKIGNIFMLAGVLFIVGCAGYTLISRSPAGAVAPQDRWHELKVSREPEGAVEKAVVEAAQQKSSVETGKIMTTCLAADEKSQLVVAAVASSPMTDSMAPKDITMYRVVDGRIDAFTETVTGPSPDADYEKTIYSAAMGAKARRENNVIIYKRPDRNLLVNAKIESGCVIKVIVKAGFEITGEVLSERKVNICNIKSGDNGVVMPRGVTR
ncbi:MAG TPA: hypothetical protein VK187_13600 [Geobacteraceae bacterium]|nr:hypothetical protein [Geobacteraceae bacterium]